MLNFRKWTFTWVIALVISATCFASDWESEDIGDTKKGTTKVERLLSRRTVLTSGARLMDVDLFIKK